MSNSYFDYPAGSDTPTTCAALGAAANTANCDEVVGDFTNVGSYTGSPSPYGTFDQGGNVWEWNEDIGDSFCPLRGGTFRFGQALLAASAYVGYSCNTVNDSFGFRVAMIHSFCDDGFDNDGDGLTDYPDDPGCADASDGSEKDGSLPCDDGADNDGDGGIDFDPVTFANPGDQYTLPSGSGDPGCGHPTWSTESPQCQDGIGNDPAQDGWIDFDGGLSAGVPPQWQTDPDPQCFAPWWNLEAPWPIYCGLGAELALLLPPLMWMRRRRRA